MKHETERIDVRIPLKVEYLRPMRRFVEDLARQSGFPDPEVDLIVMAFDEAISNSVSHCGSVQDPVLVSICLSDRFLAIQVCDSGEDFTKRFNQPVELETHLNQMRKGGLGLYIIRRFMDHVNYHRTPEHKNILTMVKLLPGCQVPESHLADLLYN